VRTIPIALLALACGSGSTSLKSSTDTPPSDDAEVSTEDSDTDTDADADSDTDSDADTDSDTDTDTDTDSDTDTDTDSDTDTDTDIDTAGDDTGSTTTAPVPVRFVALGDAGEGNTEQFAVSEAIEQVCAVRGCDFALYLGDNFYDSGVDDVYDTQFQTKFEDPYANLDIPFYVVLGNHDLGLDGLGIKLWKAPIYVDYAQFSDKWTMPAAYYSFEVANVKFYGLNTTDIFFGFGGDQETWIEDEYLARGPHIEWNIAFGHHPYVSNGQHGNAGNYEGIPSALPYSEIPRGQYIKDFFDAGACGSLDMYLSGHDHNRQWVGEACGTEFVVSGAGAKTTDLEGRGNSTFFEDDTKEGFVWIEIVGDTLTGAFYDIDGIEDFSTTLTKP